MGNLCAGARPNWTDDRAEECRRLHTTISTAFDVHVDHHERHLRAFWRALLPSSDFKIKGPEWKSIGFQGQDPTTDIRGGGLLAIEVLVHYATTYTAGFQQQLTDIRRNVNSASAAAESYYPCAATAVVVCSSLCDELGITKKMRGPVSAHELDQLFTAPPASPLIKYLHQVNAFSDLFACAFASFHDKFMTRGANYMESQLIIQDAVGELVEIASRLKTTEELVKKYRARSPRMGSLLIKAGGEATGWRIARGLLKERTAKQLRTSAGLVQAMTPRRSKTDTGAAAAGKEEHSESPGGSGPAASMGQRV